MKRVQFAFPGCATLAEKLRCGIGADRGAIKWHRFPDGESLLTLEGDCSDRDVVIVCTLRGADALAFPLLFAARTARELGARSVGLVAPYLGYLRQDSRFQAGEAISSVHVAAFLSWTFDWLVTVDPHLHRHSALTALFTVPAQHVSARSAIADWIVSHVVDPVLVGPDAESAQWVEPLAKRIDAPVVVLSKERYGDRDVEISAPHLSAIAGRTPVLVDDIISSGRTMIETIKQLRAIGAAPPTAIAVHGVFADDAAAKLIDAGAARLVTSNTIEHASNGIDVSPILARAVCERLAALQSGR